MKIRLQIMKLLHWHVFPDPRFRPLFLRYDQKISTGSATTWKLRSQLDIGSGWPARSRLECVTSCTTWLTCSGTWFAENEGMCYDISWGVKWWICTCSGHITINGGNIAIWSALFYFITTQNFMTPVTDDKLYNPRFNNRFHKFSLVLRNTSK